MKRVNTSCSSVRHFAALSCLTETLLCLVLVSYLTVWYAILVLLFFRLFSMLTHCFLIHFSFAFFMMFLIAVSPFFFFSSLLLSHRSRMSEVTQGFFVRRCLPRISLAASVTAMFIAVIIGSMSLFSFSSRMSGANFSPIFEWKAFGFSRSYFICELVGFIILFRRSRKVSIRSS